MHINARKRNGNILICLFAISTNLMQPNIISVQKFQLLTPAIVIKTPNSIYLAHFFFIGALTFVKNFIVHGTKL